MKGKLAIFKIISLFFIIIILVVKKLINSKYLPISFFCLILLIPENSNSILPSMPLDNSLEVLIATLMIALAIKLRNNKKVFTILFFTTLLLKIILLLLPSDMWKLCYQDDLITRFPGEIGQTIDNQLECEKVYHLNVQNNSSLAREINFYSDPNSEWLGANGSNFNLSFLNNKKFNFKSDGDLDRRWLPFSLTVTKDFDSKTEFLRFVYVGDLTIYKNNEKVYEGKSYLKSNEIQINGVNNKTLKILYKFEKSKGEEIRLLATNSRGYPPDLYGKLQVFDSNSKIYKTEKTIVTSFVEAIFILLIFYCLFSLSIGKNKNDLINFLISKKVLIIFYFLLIFFIFSPSRIESFPVLLIFDSFSIFIYLSTFLIFYFYDLKPFEMFLVSLAVTFLLMDLDYKLYNEYIRPGGSDSLTYEYFSRLIHEGSFFQGGEDVYTYSPAARYFIYFSHIIFGEKLKYLFIALNALVAYLAVLDNKFKFDRKNIFIYLAFIYLTSNAINRIFIFGMSEIFSLVLLMIYFKSERLKSTFPIFSGLILGLALINRPILALGILVIALVTKNRRTILSFLFVTTLPFFHNLFYGSKFTIFTEDWNYQGDVLGENFTYLEQIAQIIETATKNFHYIVMNPFYYDIYMRVGRLLPFIFLTAIVIFFYILFQKRTYLNFSRELINLLPTILLVAPLAIYDPTFFYPRFLLIPHITFLLYCQNLKNEYS